MTTTGGSRSGPAGARREHPTLFANTIVTFTGDSGHSDKIILLGVTAESLTEGSFIL